MGSENKTPKSPKAGKKVYRNKFKDVMWDYYNTNREIGKQSVEDSKNRDTKAWSATEKTYLVIIIIGIVLIGVKFLFF